MARQPGSDPSNFAFERALVPLFNLARRFSDGTRKFFLAIPFVSEFVAYEAPQLQLGEELVPPGEQDFIDRLVDVLRLRHHHEYPSGIRPMPRDFHAKAHGCVRATFSIEPNLPEEMRHGLFAPSPCKKFAAVVRLSNGQRFLESDNQPGPRGLAIKILEVPAPDGSLRTVDFLLVNFPVFIARNAAEAYQVFLDEAGNKPQAAFVKLAEPKLLAITLATVFVEVADVLDLRYFSQTPYRLGPWACKYIVQPQPAPIPPNGNPTTSGPEGPDFLRDRLLERLRAGDVKLDFLIQRQIHPVLQPVEDASVEWDEKQAIPIKVATLTLLKETRAEPFTAVRRMQCCDRMRFDPSNTLDENRPLGGINRVRRKVYKALSDLRRGANGEPAPPDRDPPCTDCTDCTEANPSDKGSS